MSVDLVVTLQGRLLARSTFAQPLVRIGRAPDNDVSIDNLAFSRSHASIQRVRDGLYVLSDHDTPNGTYVNGKRVRSWNLADGDRITVGKFVLAFRCKEAIPAPNPIRVEGGNTISVDTRPANEDVEKRCPLRARLTLLSGETREIARDAFLLGAAKTSDLVVPGWLLVPKRVALIARGMAGFTIVNLGGPGWVVKDGKPVEWQAPLESGSLLVLGKLRARFELVHVDAPTGGRLASCRT
jgi:pSer/pThr/pTyr-binding forkhead associated (FHA) protein